MSKRKHLFYIVDKEGKTMAVLNGVVQPSAVRRFLQFAPVGSKEITFIWERDKEKFALIRTFSTTLEFIRDGLKILKHTHLTENEERELYLVLQRYNEAYEVDYFEELYRTIYRGRLDFYTASDNGDNFSISIAESSLIKKMTAGEATVFDHSLQDSECVAVYHDGVKFNYKQNFILPASTPQNLSDDGSVLVGIQETTGEGTPAGIAFFSVFYEEAEPAHGTLSGDPRYFMRSTQVVESIRVKGSVKFIPLSTGGTYKLYIQTTAGRTIELVNIAVPSLRFYHEFFDLTFSAATDERFFLYHERIGAGQYNVVAYKETVFEVFVTSTFASSYVDAYPINVLNRKAVAKITGSEIYAQSSLLNHNDNLVVTSGDGLRGLPDAVVKTSYRDVYQAAKVLLFAGQAIEGDRVKIESLETFFSEADPIPLGEVKDFTISEADELMYTEFKVGYPVQTLDEVQGKLSFHNTLTYSTPRKSAEPKTLSLVCPWIACPYAQETTRINLSGKDTTDNSADNKVYIIDTEPLPDTQFNNVEFTVVDGRYYMRLRDNADLYPFFYKKVSITFPIFIKTFTVVDTATDNTDLIVELGEAVEPQVRDVLIHFHVRRIRRPAGVVLTGVPNPETVYNVLLSPASIARRWALFLNSLFWHFEGQSLTFVSTEKNREAAYTFLGATVDEDSNIVIGKLRLFITKYFNFTVPPPRDMNTLLSEMSNRGFTAVGRGIEVFGFGDKVSLSLVDNKEQGFRLLCGPSVDLSRFA